MPKPFPQAVAAQLTLREKLRAAQCQAEAERDAAHPVDSH